MKSTKICKKCGLEKSLSDFYKHKQTKDKLHTTCKVCHNKESSQNYFKNKTSYVEKRKDYHFRKRYGISKVEVEQMSSEQNHKCLICSEETQLVVDHDHRSGKVRGLLCNLCNQGIGSLKDSIPNLEAAIKYLRKNASESL